MASLKSFRLVQSRRHKPNESAQPGADVEGQRGRGVEAPGGQMVLMQMLQLQMLPTVATMGTMISRVRQAM